MVATNSTSDLSRCREVVRASSVFAVVLVSYIGAVGGQGDGSVHVVLRVETSTAVGAESISEAFVAFEVEDSWMTQTEIANHSSAGAVVERSFSLSAWPTKLRLTAPQAFLDAWGLKRIEVIDEESGHSFALLDTCTGGDCDFTSDGKHWVYSSFSWTGRVYDMPVTSTSTTTTSITTTYTNTTTSTTATVTNTTTTTPTSTTTTTTTTTTQTATTSTRTVTSSTSSSTTATTSTGTTATQTSTTATSSTSTTTTSMVLVLPAVMSAEAQTAFYNSDGFIGGIVAAALCLVACFAFVLWRYMPCGRGVPVSPTFSDYQNSSADIFGAERGQSRIAIHGRDVEGEGMENNVHYDLQNSTADDSIIREAVALGIDCSYDGSRTADDLRTLADMSSTTIFRNEHRQEAATTPLPADAENDSVDLV